MPWQFSPGKTRRVRGPTGFSSVDCTRGGDRQDGSFADVDGQIGGARVDHDRFEASVFGIADFEILCRDGRSSIEFFAGPVVVPDPWRQVDLVGPDLFGEGGGGDEDGGAEEELTGGLEVQGMTVGGGMGELEEEWADDGQAVPRGLFRGGVEVGQQAVAFLRCSGGGWLPARGPSTQGS